MSGLTRTKGIRSSSARARRERAAAQPVVDDVFARDGGCVLAHTTIAGPCWGGPTPHHLVKAWRSREGWTHRNLVTLCQGHNGWVEDQPIPARRLGLVAREFAELPDAWAAMRTHCLAVGRLVEPCPGSQQPPDTRPEAGRFVCMGCGHGHELVDGVLPAHTRELAW